MCLVSVVRRGAGGACSSQGNRPGLTFPSESEARHSHTYCPAETRASGQWRGLCTALCEGRGTKGRAGHARREPGTSVCLDRAEPGKQASLSLCEPQRQTLRRHRIWRGPGFSA